MKNLKLIVISLLLFSIIGCQTFSSFFISDEDQVEMGTAYHKELVSDPDYPIDSTSDLAKYIAKLGRYIVSCQGDEDRLNFNFDYHFYLVDDDQMVNAFALPGGFVYVYRGLINKTANEDQLVGVISHEIGHVAKEHSKQQMIKAAGLNKLKEFLQTGTILDVATDISEYMGTQMISRNDEYEADSLAVVFMTNTPKYNPNGMVQFLDTLNAMGGGSIEVFSSHPDSDKRGEELSNIISSNSSYSSATTRDFTPKVY